jgi:hypothetical protein
MPLNSSSRIAEIQGHQGTFRIIKKGRLNSRVIPVDLATGQDIGTATALVPNERLVNVRIYDELQALPAGPDAPPPHPAPEMSRTIRVPNRLYLRLQRLARPGETPAEVIERLLSPEATL